MADKKKSKKKTVKKKKKPSFLPLKGVGHKVRVKDRWRKPRGTANKQRRRRAWTPSSPNIGYGNPKSARGLRKDGTEEVMVRNLSDLSALKDRENIVIRIGGTVGKKKRLAINTQAKEMGIRIVNFREEAPAKKAAPEKKG